MEKWRSTVDIVIVSFRRWFVFNVWTETKKKPPAQQPATLRGRKYPKTSGCHSNLWPGRVTPARGVKLFGLFGQVLQGKGWKNSKIDWENPQFKGRVTSKNIFSWWDQISPTFTAWCISTPFRTSKDCLNLHLFMFSWALLEPSVVSGVLSIFSLALKAWGNRMWLFFSLQNPTKNHPSIIRKFQLRWRKHVDVHVLSKCQTREEKNPHDVVTSSPSGPGCRNLGP